MEYGVREYRKYRIKVIVQQFSLTVRQIILGQYMQAHVLKLRGFAPSGRPKRRTKDVEEISHRFKRGTEVNSVVN